jgi:hypothetical protein
MSGRVIAFDCIVAFSGTIGAARAAGPTQGFDLVVRYRKLLRGR